MSPERIAEHFPANSAIHLLVEEVLDAIWKTIRKSLRSGEPECMCAVCRQGRHRAVVLRIWGRFVAESLGIGVAERAFHREKNWDWDMRDSCGCESNDCDNARRMAKYSDVRYDVYFEAARKAGRQAAEIFLALCKRKRAYGELEDLLHGPLPESASSAVPTILVEMGGDLPVTAERPRVSAAVWNRECRRVAELSLIHI